MEEASRLRVWQVGLFGVLWCAYGSTYLLRKPLGVIKADLQLSLGVPAASLGWADAALLLPYALVSLTLGSLGDRLGPRGTLAGGLILSSAATAAMEFSGSYSMFLVLLALSGASQALCWPACCTLLARWFSDASRNTIFGMFGTCCFVFGLAGTGLAVFLMASYGWRKVFLPPAVCVAVFGVLVLVCGRDPEERGLTVPGRAAAPKRAGKETQLSMLAVWRVAQVPEVSMTMFCIKSVRYAVMFWLPLYLYRSLGYSQVTGGLASTAFEVGGVIGSACAGVVVDRWMGGRAVLTSSLAIAGSAVALLAFVLTASWGPAFHVILLALAGAFNCGPDVLLAGSVAAEIGERAGGMAAVTGVVNGMGSLGTVLEGPLVSLVTTLLGWGSMIPLMVALSAIGAVASFRAHTIHTRGQSWTKVLPVEVA